MKNHKQSNSYGVFDTALYYLTFRDHSRKELFDKLTKKGYEEAEITAAIDKLISYGYIDDERFARSYINNQKKNKGRQRIIMELSGKGVDSSTTRELFDQLSPDESETIFKLLERRFYTLDVTDEVQMRRMYSYFIRRGFRYEDIRRAVSEYRKNIEKK